MPRTTKQERETALTELRALCPPGTTVYTVLRSVSRSGMSRVIDLYVIQDGEPRWLSGYARHVLDYRLAKQDRGLCVSGGGMDMGFHLVHSLSYALHGTDPDAPIFTAEAMRLTLHDKPECLRPGYTLNHRWL